MTKAIKIPDRQRTASMTSPNIRHARVKIGCASATFVSRRADSALQCRRCHSVNLDVAHLCVL